MQVQPLSARFGAEVRDLDLSRDFDDEAFGAIHRLFVESKLLCFKNQNLSAAAQLAFIASASGRVARFQTNSPVSSTLRTVSL